MKDTNTPPTQLWDRAWQLIQRGKADKKHAYNTPTVTTVGPDGAPRSRTVVLRGCNRERATLTLWTDARSEKMTQLSANPRIAWHFWDRRAKVQFTGGGTTYLAAEADKLALFRGLPKHSRRAYATTVPPGTEQSAPTSGLPAGWKDLSQEETDYVHTHFVVLHTELTWADVLLLDRAGHRRISGKKTNGDWSVSWVTP